MGLQTTFIFLFLLLFFNTGSNATTKIQTPRHSSVTLFRDKRKTWKKRKKNVQVHGWHACGSKNIQGKKIKLGFCRSSSPVDPAASLRKSASTNTPLTNPLETQYCYFFISLSAIIVCNMSFLIFTHLCVTHFWVECAFRVSRPHSFYEHCPFRRLIFNILLNF